VDDGRPLCPDKAGRVVDLKTSLIRVEVQSPITLVAAARPPARPLSVKACVDGGLPMMLVMIDTSIDVVVGWFGAVTRKRNGKSRGRNSAKIRG
jgi:hypothetical protein